MRSPLVHAAVAAAALILVLLAPAGADAKRKVPQGWMGVNYDGAIADASDDLQAAQFPRMAGGGVESARVSFSWAAGQPKKKGALQFGPTDRVVRLAAERRIRVLPIFIVAPKWARRTADYPLSPAKHPKDMRRFVHALVSRYKPGGSFWKKNPDLPRLPIRDWQFWNEPQFFEFWSIDDHQDWAKSYAPQLRVFHRAVRDRDRKARVVLGGLANRSWERLRDLYHFGIHGYFEVADVHPFTAKPSGVVTIVRYFRNMMKRHHDGRKALVVGELAKPAAKGRVEGGTSGLKTTDEGMARFLAAAYPKLAAARRELRISRAYWYTWASPYTNEQERIFRYAGLFEYGGGDAAPSAKPAWSSFVRTARKLEGCRKRSSGRCH